ncbi:MAG: hypothetical protein IJA11_02350 [Oscillospiraceae bacterium]|nr:hypothetical protein [Oscillospiraceae bacterium]
MKKLALFLVLVLSLCACAPTQPIETDTTTKFENESFTLSIPNEYVDLLIVNPSETEWNRSNLFHVSEKASVEAAKELWPDDPTMGGGFLFGIGRVNETQFNEMMAWGMTGADVFARDAENNYYIYYHPTDVQLIRTGDYTDADWEQWGELCEWAAQIKDTFIADNSGLTPYQRTYKDLDCALVHIAFWKEEYTLLEKDGDCVYTPGYPKALPYVEQLLDGVLYFDLLTTEELNTDGHYIRLSVPGTLPHTSFDFFTDEGQQHIIRQNFDNTLPVYYVASRDGDFFPAGKVVADWLDSLA